MTEDRISVADQFIATITVFEIVHGAYKSSNPEYHLKNLEEILLPVVRVVGFNLKAAFYCGKLRAVLEKAGTACAPGDLQIAFIALANDLTLVTGNTKHFAKIPALNVENWI